jgi:predicted dehydrogenase
MSPDARAHARRPIGIALLGQGFMGEVHARALTALAAVDPDAPPVRLAALVGRDAERRERMRARFGFARASDDWRTVVEDPEVDVLDNAGPNGLHAAPTLAAVEAGRHVLCEKPLAPAPAQAWAMWEAAERAGVVHGCAYNWRFFPAVQALRSAVQAGELGELLSVSCDFTIPWREAGDSAWRRRDASQRGGVVGDLMAHHIDLVRHLVGEVVAVDAGVGSPREGAAAVRDGVEDQAVALAWTEPGTLVTLHASRASRWPTASGTFDVRGSARSLRFSLEALNELEEHDGAGARRRFVYESDSPLGRHWYPRGHPVGWDASFVHQFADFLGQIERGAPGHGALATFADGYRSAEVIAAIRRSAVERRRIAVDYREAPGRASAHRGD